MIIIPVAMLGIIKYHTQGARADENENENNNNNNNNNNVKI